MLVMLSRQTECQNAQDTECLMCVISVIAITGRDVAVGGISGMFAIGDCHLRSTGAVT